MLASLLAKLRLIYKILKKLIFPNILASSVINLTSINYEVVVLQQPNDYQYQQKYHHQNQQTFQQYHKVVRWAMEKD